MSLTICLTPEEVESRFEKAGMICRFSEHDRIRLETTCVVECPFRVFGYPLPGTPVLTLSNLKTIFGVDPKRQPSFFEHPWYSDESFMTLPGEPGWHFLSMDVLPESVGQASNYGSSLEGRGFRLPTAVEVALMLFLHYLGTGEQLLTKKHTWCKDNASLGRQVTIGAFGRNGVFLSAHPPGFTSRGLGICPAIVV